MKAESCPEKPKDSNLRTEKPKDSNLRIDKKKRKLLKEEAAIKAQQSKKQKRMDKFIAKELKKDQRKVIYSKLEYSVI
jgi:hypothetical protein